MSGAAELLTYGTATLCEAWPSARLIDRPLRPLAPGMAVAGPALTVSCQPGDNLALHLAIAAARPGDVLVVDYGGSLGSGPFGEIMALASALRGIAGLVIDGAVRDSAQIAAAGFPVFCLGLNIRGTSKRDPGRIGAALHPGIQLDAHRNAGVLPAPADERLVASDAEHAGLRADVRDDERAAARV